MGVKERLTFEDATAPTLIACEHRHRYRLARGLLDGQRVLDLCCGSGYGSRMIAKRALSVHGIDIDAATIDAASAGVGDADRISFEAADALEFLRRSDISTRFDVVVCFEGLEHLENLKATVERLRELADAGLRMVLSVPNSKGLGEQNEFHVTDFSWEDALEQLGSFPRSVVLTQYLAEGSLICAADLADAPVEAKVDLDRHEPEYANHFIFLIGFVAPPVDGLMQLDSAPVSNRYLRNLETANETLRRVNQRFTRARMGQADSAAGTLAAKYEASSRALAELEKEHEAWVERCAIAEREVEELRIRADVLKARADSIVVGGFANMWAKIRRR
jgi:SAM-dependent methyltransferase